MQYSTFFIWPNYKNRNELAVEFYEKATAKLAECPFSEDVAICLCEEGTPEGNDRFCYVFVDRRTGEDDSLEVYRALRAFLDHVGCPQEQERTYGKYIVNLGMNTIPQNLAAGNITLISGKARIGGQVRDLA